MGAGDDSAHSQNEKIDVRNYIEGVSTKIYCFKNATTTSMYFSRYLFIFFKYTLTGQKKSRYINF